MTAAFFDTNILGYASDTGSPEPEKRDTARYLIQERAVAISTQVMMELYNYLRRKLNFSHAVAEEAIRRLEEETVVSLSSADVMAALDAVARYQISHWDGLILRAAEKARVPIVYSEDLNHGQTYGSVRVCNPFIEDFLA